MDILFKIKHDRPMLTSKVPAITALRAVTGEEIKKTKDTIDGLLVTGMSATFTQSDHIPSAAVYPINKIVKLFNEGGFSVEVNTYKHDHDLNVSVLYMKELIKTALDDDQFDTAKVLIDTLKQYK